MKMTTEVYALDEAYEVTIEVDYDAYDQPARISGPPEDCCPADSEMTINGYEVVDERRLVAPEDTVTLQDEHVEEAWLKAQDRITEECWEHFYDHR